MSNRRWALSDFAAIAEIVASFAVVVSLVFLGREVRQNTAATEGATYQQVVRASNEYLLAIAGDSALAEIIVKARTDFPGLTAAEGVRYNSVRRVLWRNMENAYFQHERGVMGAAEWDVYHGILCATRPGEPDWPSHKKALTPGFVALADAC